MQPILSIVVCTARPKWDRTQFLLSLECSAAKHPAVSFEVFIVDATNRPEGAYALQFFNETRYRAVAPKPCVWQGPSRKTTRDYWAKANAINTGLLYVRALHTVFVDDSMIVHEDFLHWHQHAARNYLVMAGRVHSILNPTLHGGTLTAWDEPPGDKQDFRNDGQGHKHCSGSWLFGSNFSAPTRLLYRINGVDETYDGQRAYEDIDLGVRLQRAGGDVYYFPECLVYRLVEGREPAPPDCPPENMNRKLLEALAADPRRYQSRHGFELYQERLKAKQGTDLVAWGPETDWRTGKRLEEI